MAKYNLDKENYTQDEVKDLLNKNGETTATSLKERYSSSHISIKDYEALGQAKEKSEKEFKEYKFNQEHLPKVKQEFAKQGGKEEAFNDFYNTNKEHLQDEKLLSKNVSSIQKEKSFYFSGKQVDVKDAIGKSVKDQEAKPSEFLNRTWYKKQ